MGVDNKIKGILSHLLNAGYNQFQQALRLWRPSNSLQVKETPYPLEFMIIRVLTHTALGGPRCRLICAIPAWIHYNVQV